jgi:hypothetical protein
MRQSLFWFWCAFPAITMSLGWGLRGSIGGGPLGAMIPGAMIGLALCLLLGRHSDAGRIAAMAAIGVGFGGQETYGQTVGLSLQPETFRWALLGFAIKGAAWGLLGGAFLGIALGRVPVKRTAIGLCLMAFGTWIGWRIIDHPKLLYFSNRLDRPREELWAGLVLGGLFLLAWLRARVPWRFAVAGAIGGGVGFAFGACLQPWGRDLWAAMPLGWWKAMELTFGALLGLAYGVCAWHLRNELTAPAGDKGGAPTRETVALGHACLAIALAILVDQFLPVRFGYTLGGAALAFLVLISDSIAWQTAITATYAAFAWDLLENQKLLPEPVLWLWVAATTAVVAVVVARHARPRPMYLLLMWTAIATDFRHLLPPDAIGAGAVTMLIVFVLQGAVLHAWTWRERPR